MRQDFAAHRQGAVSGVQRVMREITYLSFGAGVQSTALLIMSNLGLYGCPRADVAIFADTGDEPSWVYENVERMREWSAIPVEVVSQGHLSQDIISRHNGARPRFAAVPAFTSDGNGRESMLRRQCTREYKIEPITKKVQENTPGIIQNEHVEKQMP